MNTAHSLRRVVAAAALAVAAPLAATPAQAAGPTHSTETLEFTAQQGWFTEVCGFPVSVHVRGSWNVVAWTDGSGALTKEIRNFRFRSTTSANGLSIEGVTMGPEIWTYGADGTARGVWHGVVSRRIPGEGTVQIFAGYEVHLVDGDVEVVLDSHGQAEDIAPVCAALTP